MKKRDDIYLREIETRIQKIASHLKRISRNKFLASDLHRSAIIRELEVIGEAANQVSAETKNKYSKLPWAQMVGMRNRLIHGYFDVDHSIVWEVAKVEIPKLLSPVREAILITAPPVHSWRVCPAGYYHVRTHKRAVDVSPVHPGGETSVRQHCRRNPSGRDQLYPVEILEIFEIGKKHVPELGKIGKIVSPDLVEIANGFDEAILVWTKYWNDVFKPAVALDPNVVKALLGSESTFGRFSGNTRVSKGNFARGPFQITDQTRKILADERGELEDHYLTLTSKDVKDPTIAAAASIRWLFQKKKLASSFLKREATWEEAVAHYKSYLKKKKPYREQVGMKTYLGYLKELENEK